MLKTAIATKLFDIGAVRFGSFTLKSGITSPIYIDLRLMVSYPELLEETAEEMWKLTEGLPKDCLCGVPYTALPIATALSVRHRVPMVMRRKEVKEYGTRRAIEGSYQKGDRCLIIEDLVTSGSSVFETIEPLKQEGLEVSDIVVLIDREQGGRQNLQGQGYQLHSVFRLSELLRTLESQKRISSETVTEVTDFLHQNQTVKAR